MMESTDSSEWMRKQEDVTNEEHASFTNRCRTIGVPISVKHFSVEGQLEFSGCIAVCAPSNFLNRLRQKKKHYNIKWYVRRVFIMDDCDELILGWLNSCSVSRYSLF